MERVIGKMATPANAIASSWIVVEQEFGFSLKFICRYEVNGQPNEFTTTKDKSDGARGRNVNDLLADVMREFTEHFCRHFVSSLLKSVQASFTARLPHISR